MKKTIGAVLCLLLLFNCLSFVSFAVEEYDLSVLVSADREYIAPGDTAVFSVDISGTCLGYYMCIPEINATGNLEIVDIVPVYEGVDAFPPNGVGDRNGRWLISTMPNNDMVDMDHRKLVEIFVKVNENAENGVETIGFDPSLNQIGIRNVGQSGWRVATVEMIPGSITVQKGYIQYTSAENFSFELNGSEATIVAYNGDDTDVKIAPVYEIEGTEYTVTAITGSDEYGAFEEKGITSVTVPNTVTAIGNEDYEGVFAENDALTSIVINGNPTIYGNAIASTYSRKNGYVIDEDAVNILTISAWSGDETVTSNPQAYAEANGISFAGLENFAYKGCQVTNDIKTAESFNIRFAGIIDSLNYQKAGYEITVTDPAKSWVSESRNVYQSLNGTTQDGTPITAVTAAELEGEYITAVTIKNVPGQTEITFEVKPYVINVLGAKVFGEIWNVNVSAGGEVDNVRQ